MNRLTTDKAASDMSMFELAHNSCYAKDRKARYRDYDLDIDARELVIKLLDKFADIPNEFTCDEDFDDFILDSMQYGTDDILGLIAVFYTNLWAMADLRERLKDYEDLEEQGKLLKLPCALGDTLYRISIMASEQITPMRIIGFATRSENQLVIQTKNISDSEGRLFDSRKLGNTVFLTWEEAEAALKKITS